MLCFFTNARDILVRHVYYKEFNIYTLVSMLIVFVNFNVVRVEGLVYNNWLCISVSNVVSGSVINTCICTTPFKTGGYLTLITYTEIYSCMPPVPYKVFQR